ncbi:hypothetical protein L0337_46205 [candidate division KSB1 bacterium]|nr:hypothetical protein [candidate division KSB1 bacterium]
MNRRNKKRPTVPALAQQIQGLNPEFARALAKLNIISSEDLRDADLDFIITQIAGLEYAVALRWQQQAFLQTLFAGITARSAGVLVDSGIVSITAMAQVDGAQLKKNLPASRLQAWKFIAANIPANLVPEQLETAREVEPLAPPQAIALYAQGIKTLHDLRSVNPSSLNFNFLPATNKRAVVLWQYLAGLRLDYGIGPAYAQQLHRRYNGDRDKIRRRLEREREKALEQISRTRRNRGSATPPDKEAVADFYLEPVCRDLADTIPKNKGRASRTLKQAQQWGSAHEISGRLVRCLADDPALGKETVIPWMLERNLTSKRGLLDLVTQVVAPEKGKKDLVGALVDQWGLGALVNLGKDSPQKDSLGSFLIEKLKTGENWTKILPDALKLLKLGSGAAEKLLGQLDLEPAKLITELFKSDEREKESGLSAILECFQEKQNFNQLKISTIFELYKEGKDFIQPFVQHLFKSGMESLSRFEELLEIPLAHAGEQNAKERDGIFAAIFKAVSIFGAETEGGLETMIPKLIAWVRQANERELVPVVEDGLLADNRDVAVVPLGVHLLGKGIQSLAGDGQESAPANRFAEKLFQILPWNDELEQEIWLHLAKIPGMLFVLLSQLLWKAVKTPMKVFQWIGQDANAIKQKDRALAIHVLEPPHEDEKDHTKDRKYVILSDIHRDAPQDDVVDEYFFDLSHFSKHRDLFIRALEYYRDNGYIVIENGDCEELWVVPSVRKNKGVRARAQSIIDPNGPHRRVFELLSELHREGRYFRTRGNHDDFWTLTPENEAMLRETWFNEGPEFKVWDALIIPEVLTMTDDYLGVIKNVIQAKQKKAPLDMEGLVDLMPIGLSPKRYHERVPLLILHGHQFDFWNCDEHSYLGKTLTNSIGIIADGISTFPYHLRGIDLDGNPLVKFTDLMAKVPQVENWLPEDHALRLSRQIEQEDEVRLLQDNIYFSETLAMAFALALKYPGQSGLLRVQILAGHTHWPQSRPALHLGCIKVPNTDFKLPLRLPTPYFNSGTCGWWESVLWGIEITSYGQPKLFYWDKSSGHPIYMSWELHDEIPEHVGRFRQKVGQFLAKCFNTTSVLEENTQNLVTWEQIDDFSDLHEIDFGSLDPSLHNAALSTAQIWAFRFFGKRDKTSQNLEIALDLNRLATRGAPSQKFSFISEDVSNPNLAGMALKALGIGKEWKKLDPQDARYQKIGSIFFYAAHFLKNSLCNKLGLLVNLFISRGREIMVRYEVEKNLFFIKLGKLEKLRE